jgi:heme o synthase
VSLLPVEGRGRLALLATGAGVHLADWAELTRLRLAVLLAFCAFVGGLLARGPGADLALVLEATLYVTLSAAAASVLNQVLEREVDGRMERTRRRPLPAGRMGVAEATFGGGILALVAIAGLALRFNLISALLVAVSILIYVAIYTPLKRTSTLNTVVGALPGAAPPLIAYAALAGDVHGWGAALFALVFAWQFPHFMAIAWLYREDYNRAGMRMLAALPGCEGVAGRQAVGYALLLLPISLLPVLWGLAGPVYLAGALLLGVGYLVFAARFALRCTRPRARGLLFASLAHLPLMLSVILFDPIVQHSLRS